MIRDGYRTWSGVRRYVERDLWTLDAARRGVMARLGVGALRAVMVLVRALTDPDLNLEATALVYRTLLSLVPLLAVAFSVLKAFGAHYEIEGVLAHLPAPLGPGGAEPTSAVGGSLAHLTASVLAAV